MENTIGDHSASYPCHNSCTCQTLHPGWVAFNDIDKLEIIQSLVQVPVGTDSCWQHLESDRPSNTGDRWTSWCLAWWQLWYVILLLFLCLHRVQCFPWDVHLRESQFDREDRWCYSSVKKLHLSTILNLGHWNLGARQEVMAFPSWFRTDSHSPLGNWAILTTNILNASSMMAFPRKNWSWLCSWLTSPSRMIESACMY